MKRYVVPFLVLVLAGHSSVSSFQDQNANTQGEKTYTAEEVDRKAVIIRQPQPPYTARAMDQHVVGVVELMVVLGANGDVKSVEVRKGLPAGLTEIAIRAARMTTFTPAIKDGNPVSQKMAVEYVFTQGIPVIHGQRFPRVFYDERCREYSNIPPKHMVFFTNEKEARRAGYKKSKTCP